MKILGIIPARYASTRFPAKPLIQINGKSMIQRVYEQACKTTFNKIVIATDDDRIYNHALEFGAHVMMTNTTHLNGTERCAEVISKIGEKFDIVVNIQGDEPFVQPEMLQQLANTFSHQYIQIATLIKQIDHLDYLSNPSIIKVVKNKMNEAMYFSRSAIPFARNTIDATVYYKHIGIYAFRTEILLELVKLKSSILENTESLEQLRWLENGYKIFVEETTMEADSIDTPEDLDRVLKKYF